MLYISLAIIQIVFFEANFLVYRTIRDIFSFTGEPLLVLKIIFVILSISFIATSALAHAFKNKIVKIIYTAAAIWFGFLMYFLLASALYWIVVIFGGKEISNSESAFAGMIFFAGATLTGIWGMINASRIRIKRIALYIPNMPKVWKNRKAVLISDMHLGQIRGKSFALKITNIIKWLSPDIVFLAGDTFDGVMVNMDECLAPFSEIKASLGIFSVIGNHEEFKEDSARKYISAMQKNGIKTLENESMIIDGIQIIGLTDSDAINKEKYKAVLERIAGKNKIWPRILLKHTPVSSEIAEDAGVDLELSGHTHGGQVFPFNIITPLLFKDRNYGLSRFGKMIVYTSSGVGTWGPPMRIGTDPEIVLISFENKSS